MEVRATLNRYHFFHGVGRVRAKHRQQQEASLYSSAAPKEDCKPHCSHVSIMGAQHLKNTEFRSTQKLCHQFKASLAELSRVSRNRSRVLKRG